MYPDHKITVHIIPEPGDPRSYKIARQAPDEVDGHPRLNGANAIENTGSNSKPTSVSNRNAETVLYLTKRRLIASWF
jgi:hypothetical protein